MSTSTTQAAHITVQEFLDRSDVGACELVRGRLVRRGPKIRHGRLGVWISHLLFTHVEPRRLGTVASGLSFVIRSEPHTVRVPDIVYISYARLPPDAVAALEESGDVLPVPPDLAVEILSPDDEWSDVEEKIAEYLTAGVRMTWIVNGRQKTVHVYRHDQTVRRLTAEQVLTGEDVLPEFAITVEQLCTVGSLPVAQQAHTGSAQPATDDRSTETPEHLNARTPERRRPQDRLPVLSPMRRGTLPALPEGQ